LIADSRRSPGCETHADFLLFSAYFDLRGRIFEICLSIKIYNQSWPPASPIPDSPACHTWHLHSSLAEWILHGSTESGKDADDESPILGTVRHQFNSQDFM
jgi:hypothetical protein